MERPAAQPGGASPQPACFSLCEWPAGDAEISKIATHEERGKRPTNLPRTMCSSSPEALNDTGFHEREREGEKGHLGLDRSDILAGRGQDPQTLPGERRQTRHPRQTKWNRVPADNVLRGWQRQIAGFPLRIHGHISAGLCRIWPPEDIWLSGHKASSRCYVARCTGGDGGEQRRAHSRSVFPCRQYFSSSTTTAESVHVRGCMHGCMWKEANRITL